MNNDYPYYCVGGPIREPWQHYGRKQLIDGIMSSNDAAVFIKGNRRMGKTSLLYMLESKYISTFSFFPVYCSIQGSQTPEEMGQDLIQAIDSVLEKKHIGISPKGPSNDFISVILNWSKNNASINKRCVLLLDEAEELLSLDEKYLLKLRKLLFDKNNNLLTIITATSRLQELNQSNAGTSPFLHGFNFRTLGPLTVDEVKELILQSQNPVGPISVQHSVLNDVIKYCGEHPFFVQKICQNLLNYDDRSLRNTTYDDFSLTQEFSEYFKNDFNGVSDEFQKIIINLNQDIPMPLPVIARATSISQNDLILYLRELVNLGFILEENNQYRLRNFFFAQWIAAKQPARVFISYSHKDTEWKDKLMVQMAPLLRQQKIVVWDDTQIQPGTRWEKEIEVNLQLSKVFLFLISPDLLNSSFVMDKELPLALSKEKDGSAVVIPVVVRPCLWKDTDFSKFQALTKDGKPISLEGNVDDALFGAVNKLRDWLV